MNTDYYFKKITTSLTLFTVMGALISLPIISFNAFKGPKQNNEQVLGTSTTLKTTNVVDGRIKYSQKKTKMVNFEVVLEPKEYFTKGLSEAKGTSQIVLTEGSNESYATNTDGQIEIMNLSDNAVLVKGVVF